MKLIWAVIRTNKKDEVEKALMERKVGITGLIAWKVLGIGEETQRLLQPHALQYIKMEILVKDDQVEDVVEIIRKTVWSGNPGDGRIAVIPVDDVIHIGSGKKGEEALEV